MRELIDRIQGWWCETMHDRAMWPIHGKYRCATCLREYAVGFEETAKTYRSLTVAALMGGEYRARFEGAAKLLSGNCRGA